MKSLNILIKKINLLSKRLHVFDWILIGLTVLTIIVFAFLFFRKSIYIVATVKVGEESVAYSSWLTGSPYWNDTSGTKMWFADILRVGQAEKDGLGNVKAEILDIYSYDKTQTRKTVYLTLRLNAVYNKASDSYTYKGVPVLAGSKIKLNLDNLYVEGLVLNVGGQKKPRDIITVEAQIREENSTFLETSGTKAYLADAIKVGDEVKDNKGETLIKIIDKKVVPARKTIITSDGRVVLGYDPIRREVYLTLEVSAEKIGDRYFFLDDIPILIDQIIPINTSSVSVFPIVTRFISVK